MVDHEQEAGTEEGKLNSKTWNDFKIFFHF